LWSTDCPETLMILGKPAPFVHAFVEAIDDAMRAHHPSHAMSATQRTWLAFCVTAVLVTNSICWARFERASLGTYSLAALSWMFRHSKMPWDKLLIASVQVILRHHGLTSGTLVIDDTDNPRSKSAKALAHLYNPTTSFKLSLCAIGPELLPLGALSVCAERCGSHGTPLRRGSYAIRRHL
jgi:hypothetical protein